MAEHRYCALCSYRANRPRHPYDIPDDKRRTKVHKILLGFVKWRQYSLFECFLSRKELVLLRSKLAEQLVEKQDSVRFYPLCAQCLAKPDRSAPMSASLPTSKRSSGKGAWQVR